MQRKEKESYINYCERCTQALALGTINYQEWATDVLGEIPYSDETLRRCSLFFSRFLDKLNQEEINSIDDADKLVEIRQAKDELERERMKIHQQNLELKENYRWQARNELYQERIIDAINNLEPIEVKVPHNLGLPKVDSTGLICLSDFHAGSTFEIKGLYDEIVNKYSFDIMKARMWRLLDKLEQDDVIYDNGKDIHAIYKNKNGEIVPSATTVLKIINKPALLNWANWLGLTGKSYKKHMEMVSYIGTTVHEIIECRLLGKKFELKDPKVWFLDCKEYINSFNIWYKENPLEPIAIEDHMESDRFGGTCDFYGIYNGKKTIIDFKTSR